MSFRLLMAAPFRACIRSAHPLAPAVLTLALALPCWSHSRTLTASDYARAEKLLGYNTNRLVLHAPARPVWLPDDRFWYRVTTEKGNEIVLVDPARGTRGPCEAQQEVKCTPLPRADANSVLSPDRNRAAFIRDFNLWVRETASGKETQLTKDGVKDFGYATDNAGWIRSDRPVVLWSPDSKKIATFLHDARGVGEMYLVHTAVGHPTLEAWKYPLAGDDKIFQISRVIIDVENTGPLRSFREELRRITGAAELIAPHISLLYTIDAREQRTASVVSLRSRAVRRYVCRRPVERRQHATRFRLLFARSQTRNTSRCRCRDRQSSRSDRRKSRNIFRRRKRPAQLALSSRFERGDLVFRARQLGRSLSVRPQHRETQEQDHQRPGQCFTNAESG